MVDAFEALPPEERDKLKKTSFPGWIDPMLAVLTREYFSRQGWIFEPKLDGERCISYKNGGDLRMLSRNKKILNGGYPDIAAALVKEKHDFVLDGEVVAFEDGHTSFKKLQGRIGLHDVRATRKNISVYYYVFDLLYLDGYDTRRVKLIWRKMLLKEALRLAAPVRFTPHIETEGQKMYRKACSTGEEGVMAKRADAEYVSARSPNWLKFKCSNRQEFVIGGYTPGRGKRAGLLGAILVGYYQDGRLRYAGKVGTGFSDGVLRELAAELERLAQDAPPFAETVPERSVTWVEPKLVAEIEFGEWTQYGRLRIPRFQGLRRDKPPHKVVKEG